MNISIAHTTYTKVLGYNIVHTCFFYSVTVLWKVFFILFYLIFLQISVHIKTNAKAYTNILYDVTLQPSVA